MEDISGSDQDCENVGFHTSLTCIQQRYMSNLSSCNPDACDLTLDPNTANTKLILSEEKRKATLVEDPQPYSHHPERFEHYEQALCRESLTGRCYWEAEWSGWVDIAVTRGGKSTKIFYSSKSTITY